MKKYFKIMTDSTKKDTVLDVLHLLNGESYSDAVEMLDCARYFLKANAYLDFDLAKELIEADYNE